MTTKLKKKNECTDLELMTRSILTQHNTFFVFRTILNGFLHFQAITPAFTFRHFLWNKKPKMYLQVRFSQIVTEITRQNHIKKFEEEMVWGWVSCLGSFVTSTGSSALMRTMWMQEMNPSQPFVLQIFWYDFGEWCSDFLSFDLGNCIDVMCFKVM